MPVGVSESNIGFLPHEVLQILPADARGKVLHENSVGSAHWRAISEEQITLLSPGITHYYLIKRQSDMNSPVLGNFLDHPFLK